MSPPIVDRSFIVFFDWGSTAISERGQQVIAEAVRHFEGHRLRLDANADRSGPAGYNRRLSRRRGEAVRDELVRQGFPSDRITIRAFGESRPLVPTKDGVREPQNRRVDIFAF